MQENNIDFDIYINVSDDIGLKHPNENILKKQLDIILKKFEDISFVENNKKKFTNLTKDYSGWHMMYIKLGKKYVEDYFKNIFGIKIKMLKITEHDYYTNNLNYSHLHFDFFNTITYTRWEEINQEIINNDIKYDKYISMRPDYFLYDNFNLDKILYSNKFFYNSIGRLDFIYIYDKILPQMINTEIKNNIVKMIYSKKYHSFEKIFFDYGINILNIETSIINNGMRIDIHYLENSNIIYKL